jgi:hypothetical protein
LGEAGWPGPGGFACWFRAQAQEALGRRQDARATLEEAIRTGERYPELLRPRTPLGQARDLLAALGEG